MKYRDIKSRFTQERNDIASDLIIVIVLAVVGAIVIALTIKYGWFMLPPFIAYKLIKLTLAISDE